MKIEIVGPDGFNKQTAKVKGNITVEQAMELLKSLAEEDYLGCSYYLLDEEDEEILAIDYVE